MMYEKEEHEPNLEFGGAFGSGPRETVADLLRRAREEYGQDIRSVAEILRIRPAYLEAIESGDFDQLPGTTYAVGFLRTYAEYLGLDGENMVERFKAETQAAARRSELIFPEPVAEGRIPGGAIILVSVVLLAVAYGGWFYMSQQGGSFADLIPAWPTDTQTAEPADAGPQMADTKTAAAPAAGSGADQAAAVPASEAADAPAEPAAEPSIVTTASARASTAENESTTPVASAPESQPSVTPDPAPVAATPAPETAAAAPPAPAAESPAPAAESADAPTATVAPVESAPLGESPAPAEAPQTLATLLDQTVVIPAPPEAPETVIIPDDRSPRTYGGSNDESRIVIRALQDSWVQVRDSQDAILLTRVLHAGDSYRVPDVAGLTLLTGNAGGIELEVDGVRLPPVGPQGSVRRSITLDPAQLLSGTANR